jgi:hypothetical protein
VAAVMLRGSICCLSTQSNVNEASEGRLVCFIKIRASHEDRAYGGIQLFS